MLTKHFIEIDGVKHEIPSRCIKNWEDVKCAYKRTDYSGVLRSFTSQFEFVDDAYEMIMNLYLRDGFRSVATIYLYAITDNWEWEERFSAPIDFSSLVWDNYTLKVNCIDNSLAALIKARKGTKYEFELGKDINLGQNLMYDRVEMLNTVTHCIVGNGTDDSGATVIEHSPTFRRLPTYSTNNEVYAGSPILCQDEDTDGGSSFLSVVGSVNAIDITTDILFNGAYNIEIHLFEFDASSPDFNDSYKDLGVVFNYSWQKARARQFLGVFDDIASLKRAYPIPPDDSWAGVGLVEPSSSNFFPTYKKVYFAPDTDRTEDKEWTDGYTSFYFGTDWEICFDCSTQRFVRHIIIENPVVGKHYALFYKTYVADNVKDKTTRAIVKSSIKSQWFSRAGAINIDALTPQDVATVLLNKITDSNIHVNVHLSENDTRLKDTFIVAAESIRGIKNAKLYTSFNDFCNWLETVFGYVYYLGSKTADTQDVYFVHRSEIFNATASHRRFNNAMEVSYSIDKTNLFSIVEIGYEKKDYEAECGRDEWNFTQYYNTGIDINEKKLTMQSKYRSDCYGFEFLSQKRNQDTTDTESDNDIFFVYCKEVVDNIESNDTAESRGDSSSVIEGVSSHIVINRSVKISGALTDTVFNGEFSPHYCLKANEGYISAMASPLTLQFASSDGNSEIAINGVKVTDNIQLSNRLFTPGSLSFETDDVEEPESVNTLIEIESNGIIYRGFIEDLQLRFANNEAAKYKLIVKDIELC